MTATDVLDQIRDSFQAYFEAAGRPAGMAVFTRYDSEDRLHCEVNAYFSPEAERIAKTLHAQPCDKPLRKGLGLLTGTSDCWAILFPENQNS
ncbi:MAG: hypothetical protein HYZ25_19940 [Chloroflexi bacterium]|nr:hypothetical protein [Chloroflexota bacterium]